MSEKPSAPIFKALQEENSDANICNKRHAQRLHHIEEAKKFPYTKHV